MDKPCEATTSGSFTAFALRENSIAAAPARGDSAASGPLQRCSSRAVAIKKPPACVNHTCRGHFIANIRATLLERLSLISGIIEYSWSRQVETGYAYCDIAIGWFCGDINCDIFCDPGRNTAPMEIACQASLCAPCPSPIPIVTVHLRLAHAGNNTGLGGLAERRYCFRVPVVRGMIAGWMNQISL